MSAPPDKAGTISRQTKANQGKGSKVKGTSLRVQARHPREDPLPLSSPPGKAGTISRGVKSESQVKGSQVRGTSLRVQARHPRETPSP